MRNLAKTAKAPVKLMLDRAEEVTNGGLRPSAFGKIKIGCNQNGEIKAFEAEAYGSPGSAANASVLLPYVYPNIPTRRVYSVVRTNTQRQRAFRARVILRAAR